MRHSLATAVLAAVVLAPALARAQAAPVARDSAAMAAELRSVQDGAHAGRAAASRQSVGLRRVAGFLGGMPLGFATLVGGFEGQAPVLLGSVAGVAVVTALASAGTARPARELTEAADRRGPAYSCAFAAAYGATLRSRRRAAALDGSLVGTLAGALSVLALIGAMAGGT